MKLSVVVGRFRPVHNGHMDQLIMPAYHAGDVLLVLIGSANLARSHKNPLSYEEAKFLLKQNIDERAPFAYGIPGRVIFAKLEDTYDDASWYDLLIQVVLAYTHSLRATYGEAIETTLYGVDKDESTYYFNGLKNHPMGLPFDLHLFPVDKNAKHFSSTHVREAAYTNPEDLRNMRDDGLISKSTYNFMSEFMKSETGARMAAEYHYCLNAKAIVEQAKAVTTYPYNSVAVDAILEMNGKVLLVKRGKDVGRDTYAIPGGFLNEDETALQGALREAREETAISIDPSWLQEVTVADNPSRSLRGRVLSIVHHFEVPNTTSLKGDIIINLTNPHAGDDAKEAVWVDIDDIVIHNKYYGMFHEDHEIILKRILTTSYSNLTNTTDYILKNS
jgi:bifunctional NMN adenylyltransferase/nudix hydrolase